MKIRSVQELGLRIRDRRQALGWSQARLADEVGATRQWIMSLERGNAGAALGQVMNVLAVLRLDLHVREPGATSQPGAHHSTSSEDAAALLNTVLQRTRDPSDRMLPRTPLRRLEQD